MREFMFSEICDINNEFDVIMLGVFSAYNDLMTISSFVENKEKIRFIFRYHIVIIKEAASFLYNIIFKDVIFEKIKEFPNSNEILILKEEYENCKDFNINMLESFRNHTVHYKNPKAYKEFFANKDYTDFDTKIIIGDVKKDVYYEFIDYLDYNIFLNEYCKKCNLEADEISMEELIDKTTKFGILIANLLDAIAIGFINKKLNNKG